MDHSAAYNSDSSAYNDLEKEPSAFSKASSLVILPAKKRYAYAYFKRFFDIIISLILIPLLLPFLLIVSLLVKISSPGKVIFKQKRIGQYGKPFTIYKFRTMKEDAPSETATSAFNDADKYITKIGRFLRRTSIDELPQIFNILLGEMSLIGPRPLVVTEKEIHTLRLARSVYNIKPGVTGLAQISGRDLVKPIQKVEYDEKYLTSLSFSTDIKIFAKTIYIVIARKGNIDGCQIDSVNKIRNVDSYRSHTEKL